MIQIRCPKAPTRNIESLEAIVSGIKFPHLFGVTTRYFEDNRVSTSVDKSLYNMSIQNPICTKKPDIAEQLSKDVVFLVVL